MLGSGQHGDTGGATMEHPYRVYDGGGSGNGYKVWLFLNLLGIGYDYQPVDVPGGETRTPTFLAINPAGKIPVLEMADGQRLTESNAILFFLAERHGPDWIPADAVDRARMLAWMFWEQYSHEPYIAVLRYWRHFIEMTETHRRQLPEKTERGYAALDIMEMQLGRTDWLVGASPTLADLSLYAYTHVADEGGFDLTRYPGINAWLDRVAALPGYRPITYRP